MFFMPVGVVMPYASTTAPDLWLLCDGSAVSRTEYAALFAVIGTTYGTGDGSTTFNLPNLKGRTVFGYSGSGNFSKMGTTGGAETVTLTVNQIPSHTHTITEQFQYEGGYLAGIHYAADQDKNPDSISKTTGATGGGSSHNNMPPYITMNYIIYAGV